MPAAPDGLLKSQANKLRLRIRREQVTASPQAGFPRQQRAWVPRGWQAVSPRFPQPRAKRCLQFSGCFWKILLEFLGKISSLSLQTEKENNQKKKGRAQKEDYLEVRHSLISQIFTRQVHSFS